MTSSSEKRKKDYNFRHQFHAKYYTGLPRDKLFSLLMEDDKLARMLLGTGADHVVLGIPGCGYRSCGHVHTVDPLLTML